MNPGNKEVANLVKIISLEDRLGKQAAGFVSSYVLNKASCLFSRTVLWSLHFTFFFSVCRVRPGVAACLPSVQWTYAKTYLL